MIAAFYWITMTNSQQKIWRSFADAPALEHTAVQRILSAASEAIAARGAFHLVLAGGTTPRRIYQALRHAAADWSHWHIYFGDERCLPPTDAERNSQMAASAWLNQVAILPAHCHILPAELGATVAATRYAETLASVAEFDLVLLGLGEDGHTASLFPGQDWGTAPAAPDVLAVFDAPKPPPERVSLSARRLSRARRVIFLVTGAAKREAVAVWHGGGTIPATAVAPSAGVEIFVEAALLPV